MLRLTWGAGNSPADLPIVSVGLPQETTLWVALVTQICAPQPSFAGNHLFLMLAKTTSDSTFLKSYTLNLTCTFFQTHTVHPTQGTAKIQVHVQTAKQGSKNAA